MDSRWRFSTVFILIVFIINLEDAKCGKIQPPFQIKPDESPDYILGSVEAKSNSFDAGTINLREKPSGILECTANMEKKYVSNLIVFNKQEYMFLDFMEKARKNDTITGRLLFYICDDGKNSNENNSIWSLYIEAKHSF